MKYFIVVFILFSNISLSNEISDSIFEVDLAKEKYNRIVLPVPYKNVIFSKGAKIDKPIKLNSGRLMLIRPKASALQTFSATFVLANEESFQVMFNPVLKDRPSIWRYRDASDIQGSVKLSRHNTH